MHKHTRKSTACENRVVDSSNHHHRIRLNIERVHCACKIEVMCGCIALNALSTYCVFCKSRVPAVHKSAPSLQRQRPWIMSLSAFERTRICLHAAEHDVHGKRRHGKLYTKQHHHHHHHNVQKHHLIACAVQAGGQTESRFNVYSPRLTAYRSVCFSTTSSDHLPEMRRDRTSYWRKCTY